MEITINGDTRDCTAATIAELVRSELREQIEVEAQAIDALRGFAVARNGNVVRRSDWEITPVTEGDRIDIIRAYSGG